MVSSKKINDQVFRVRRNLGIRLYLLRKKKEMSVSEVAEVCGLSANRIEMIEDGRSFSLKHLFMLASVYGVRVKILFR